MLHPYSGMLCVRFTLKKSKAQNGVCRGLLENCVCVCVCVCVLEVVAPMNEL